MSGSVPGGPFVNPEGDFARALRAAQQRLDELRELQREARSLRDVEAEFVTPEGNIVSGLRGQRFTDIEVRGPDGELIDARFRRDPPLTERRSRRTRLREEIREIREGIAEAQRAMRAPGVNAQVFANRRADEIELRRLLSEKQAELARITGQTPGRGRSPGEPTERQSPTQGGEGTGEPPTDVPYTFERRRDGDLVVVTSDGRRYTYDLVAQRFIVEGANPRAHEGVLGGPREQFVRLTATGEQIIVAGLYTDPNRSGPVGAIVVRPGSDAQRATAENRLDELRRKYNDRGLTMAELVEYNRLRAALAGNTLLTLGLPGGGSFADARGRIVTVDSRGRERIQVFGDQQTLNASITGIWPTTPGAWLQWIQNMQSQLADIRNQIADLDRRIGSIQAGRGDPGASRGGAAGQRAVGTGQVVLL